MTAFTTVLPIRFGDIDHAKILYYPAFYHYCHQAFEDLWPERLGVHYRHTLDVDKVGFPAVRQEMEFISPVRYGEDLRVTISCATIGNKSVTLDYELADGTSGEVRARCRMVLACLDMESYRGIPLPERYREVFEGLT